MSKKNNYNLTITIGKIEVSGDVKGFSKRIAIMELRKYESHRTVDY